MQRYTAFGLQIESGLSLPEVCSGEDSQGAADVRILINPHVVDAQATIKESSITVDRHLADIILKQVGRFQVVDGREIRLWPAAQLSESRLRLIVLGPLFAILLYQRGSLVLHASCVQIDNQAVAFIGESGWGKSSLAALFHLHGYGALSDDLTVIDLADGHPMVQAGFPRLKISPEMASSLGLHGRHLDSLDAEESRIGLKLDRFTAGEAHPLSRIYLLDEQNYTAVRPLSPKEAVIQLIRHSYPIRLQQSGDAQHLAQVGQLAGQIPVISLSRPKRLDVFPELVKLIAGNLPVSQA